MQAYETALGGTQPMLALPTPTVARPTHSHPHAGGPAGAEPKLYNSRHTECTLSYQTIAEHFETWHALPSAGQFDGQDDHHTPELPKQSLLLINQTLHNTVVWDEAAIARRADNLLTRALKACPRDFK